MKPYTCISTDDHVQEPADLWTSRMSKKWGDLIPRVESVWDDKTARPLNWVLDGEPIAGIVVEAVLDDRDKPPTTWEEVPTISWVPSERVKAMDQDGVDVHTLHSNWVTQRSLNDGSNPEEFRLEATRAYNDFIIEEYGDAFPGRFICLAQVPTWDARKAATEFQRALAASSEIRGVNFVFPQVFGNTHFSDPSWDPLWGALQEADLPLHLHIGSGGSVGVAAETWSGHTDPQRRLAERGTKGVVGSTTAASTLLFSGILDRFPKLKVVFAETGVGWISYLLELADHEWERGGLADRGMKQSPRELFLQHCYANFWFEKIDDQIREDPGISNVMWLSDFPHPTALWPDSQKFIANSLEKVTEAEQRAILVDNPRHVYNLPQGY